MAKPFKLDSLKEAFLSLVRLGIGQSVDSLPEKVDWETVETLADYQGLSAVILDGVVLLPEELLPPKMTFLAWFGEVLQGYEQQYELYRQFIAKLAGFYNSHGLKMMVLKGYACSLDWPRPEHRPCGDIDIWQFGEQKAGDALIASEKRIKIDNSHHHHTVFNWGDFMVENHYDFVNVYSHKSSVGLEKIFKELGQDDTHCVEVLGEKVYLPSPNLHALFLIRHMVSHFASTQITLRQVLDWAFFVDRHSREVDWTWLQEVLKDFHMDEFFGIINGICVEDLGFDESIFPPVRFDPLLKDRVLADIINPPEAATPRKLLPRLVFKYKRWQSNAWKQEMCYDESRFSAFFTGLWAHIIKPSSF